MHARRAVGWGAVLILAAGGAVVLWAPFDPGASAPREIGAPRSQPVAVTRPTPVAASEGEPLAVFAVGGGVRLRQVARAVLGVAFHEASRPEALALRPVGRCVECRNRGKFTPARWTDPGRRYVVMDARGRPFPATSAVDIVLARGQRVLAPVSGMVRTVTRYFLYGRHPDVRVAINPDGVRHRQVVVIHLRGVRLVRGDRVVAGETVMGRARRFPFPSQVDRYVRGGHPHVHIEVKEGAPPERSAFKGAPGRR